MSDKLPRPVGIAMSDGTVAPWGALGGLKELAGVRGVSKGAVSSWYYRDKEGMGVNPFPGVVVRYSTGPLFFVPDILDYVPGTSVALKREREAG